MTFCNPKLNRFFIIIFTFSIFLTCIWAKNAPPVAAGVSDRDIRKIDSLMTSMTVEEKLGQLNQVSGSWDKYKGATVTAGQKRQLRDGKIGSFLNVYGAEETRKLQKIAVEETRLGIPLIFGFDVIHGFRTTFPVPIAEASSWDTSAVRQSARSAALEAAAAGIHWTFAPMVDIARDPRWGRIAEGSGEDPFLGAAMAAARVKGFQGENLTDANTIMACAKHFAAYGGAEGGRDYNTVDISERTLREVYLPPFQAALDAGAGSFMAAFNEIDGIPCSANRFLLTQVLRNEWGFQGFVVSDWTSVKELRAHRIAPGDADAGQAALDAGVDMDMVSQIYVDKLPDRVRNGRLSGEVLDRSVRRVLMAKARLGLFDDPYRYCNSETEKAELLNPAHLAKARDMARKSIVLLKNESELLPLDKNIKKLAVIGPLADDHEDPLGPWAQVGHPEDVITVLQGIRDAVSPSTKIVYARGCGIEGGSMKEIDLAARIASEADAAIVVVGESLAMSGEAHSRSSLQLPGLQKELLQAVYKTGKPVVAVLMNGRPLAINWTAEHVPAILETWFLGLQSGHAVADVIFGDYNPSGKLPVTVPRSAGQIPCYYNHKSTGRPGTEQNAFTSKYIDLPLMPLFPFGFGLSYTTFKYSDLQLSDSVITPDCNLTVSVKVTNQGERSGEETAQLYLCDLYSRVTRPVKELKGFCKVELKPGEARQISFRLRPDDFAFLDSELKKTIEPGAFKIFVGPNSADCLETSLQIKPGTNLK